MITVNSDGLPVSPEFSEAVAQPIVGYGIALLADGEPVRCEVRRMQLTMGSAGDAGASGDGMALGGVYSASAELSLAELEGTLTGRELEVRVGVDVAGGGTEYVTVATLAVMGVRKSRGVATVAASGSIAARMGEAFPGGGSMAAAEVAAGIAYACGVAVEVGAFATVRQQVHVAQGATCRQALAALASALGGFAAELPDGSVLVCPYSSEPTCEVGADSMTAYPQLDELDYVLDGLTVAVPAVEGAADEPGEGSADEDEEAEGGESGEGEAGEDSGAFYTFGTGRYVVADAHATAETAAALWQNVRGYAYRPGTVTTAVLDPRVTPFDVASVEADGETVNVPVMGLQATYDGGYFGTITAPGMSRAAEDAATAGPVTGAVDKAALAAERAAAASDSAVRSAADAAGYAQEARDKADEAIVYAGVAQGMASDAARSADAAAARAEDATVSAWTAAVSANGALMQLAAVEDVVGVLEWIGSHGRWVAATETEPVDGRTYYSRTGAGTADEPYGYEPAADIPYGYAATADAEVDPSKAYYELAESGDGTAWMRVAEPTAGGLASYRERVVTDPSASGYYYLEVTDSVQSYLASHLAQTDHGLDVMFDGTDDRIHIGTVDGTREKGVYLFSGGVVQSAYRDGGLTVGPESGFHITLDASVNNGELAFWQGVEKVAYINAGELYIPRSVVLESMRLGRWVWVPRANGNLSLKWR